MLSIMENRVYKTQLELIALQKEGRIIYESVERKNPEVPEIPDRLKKIHGLIQLFSPKDITPETVDKMQEVIATGRKAYRELNSVLGM